MIHTWVAVLAVLSCAAFANADTMVDLEQYAKTVPVQTIDKTVRQMIVNETNQEPTQMKSHYVLALFESTVSSDTWYILDGYFEMPSGDIFFVDFLYEPVTQSVRPIGNYRSYLPGSMTRYLLRAEKICDPAKRSLLGILRGSIGGREDFSKIHAYFESSKVGQPLYMLNESDLVVVDQPKSSTGRSEMLFSAEEKKLIADLKTQTGVELSVIPSGREPSTAELKKTYVGVSGVCL